MGPEADATPPTDETSPEPARTRAFRKPFNGVRLPADSAERQGRVARLAFEALGREGATEFLNGFDAGLGGRPLDLAVASAEGLAAVEALIAARKAGA
jgi:hypothetical protein